MTATFASPFDIRSQDTAGLDTGPAGGIRMRMAPMQPNANGERSVLDTLLARTASGDAGAFRSLYERTAGRLFAICLRIARERSLAEDFLQEAFTRIWERASQFDPTRGSALAWMVAVTRNHAIDVIRQRRRETPLPDNFDFDVPASATTASAETNIDFEAVSRCLAALDEGPRRAIISAYRDGLSYAELSDLLGVPIGTVKTWVHRGIAKLRSALDHDK
jgi:RNA polymerase sigma-70 factor (ECF subfamily)